MPVPRRLLLLAPAALAACAAPLPPERFAGTTPELRPERFFAGRVHSWGAFEDGEGAPTSQFTTESTGTPEPDGTLVLDQLVRLGDGTTQRRVWRVRRVDAHRYEATLPAVPGLALGEAYGRHFHWQYSINPDTGAPDPGSALRRVSFEHWMYLSDDGAALLNRFAVRKFGVVVARASEVFVRA